MPYLSQLADHRLLLRLHVQPKAAKSKVAGLFDDCLKLTIQAPPVEGRANEEVLRFLAGLLEVPLRQLAIVSGAKGRRKQVVVSGITAAEVSRKLEPLLDRERVRK